jgi:hypothetical protein
MIGQNFNPAASLPPGKKTVLIRLIREKVETGYSLNVLEKR